MIYQLPNGRYIELSIEDYLSMDEQELRDLNSLGDNNTTVFDDPFIDVFSSTERLDIDEVEPELLDIEEYQKFFDEDFVEPDD